jgi:hypothetical protein
LGRRPGHRAIAGIAEIAFGVWSGIAQLKAEAAVTVGKSPGVPVTPANRLDGSRLRQFSSVIQRYFARNEHGGRHGSGWAGSIRHSAGQ